MSLNNTTDQLNTTHKRLHQRWEATKAVWNDPVQQDFEKRYVEPIEREMQETLREMARLAEVMPKHGGM